MMDVEKDEDTKASEVVVLKKKMSLNIVIEYCTRSIFYISCLIFILMFKASQDIVGNDVNASNSTTNLFYFSIFTLVISFS